MKLTSIDGGICAAKGFRAAGIHCGIRKNASKNDLALIVAEKRCPAAGVFTTNKVFAAPVGVTRAHLSDGYAQAVIANSGNANTCNSDGYDKANLTCETLASKLGISAGDVIVGSTGVIGVPLPIEPILSGMDSLIASLSSDVAASDHAATAIMTTDTKKKEFAYEFELDGKLCHMGGICKGSGMIEPNMATMLCFLTTDAAISPEMLKNALRTCISDTFNMVSVDRDTSTNDTVTIMASGLAGNTEITTENEDYTLFTKALFTLCRDLSMAIAADGEGASRLLECTVSGFSDKDGAKILAKSVIRSSLVKAAMFGADANWGRILCALGYSGVDFDPDRVDVSFRSEVGSFPVCKNGRGIPFSEEFAKEVLTKSTVYIDINMNCGEASATAWGCDLTYEYVRINGDYRS
ncbi:MAG: bifunctional glutamate N-acetyltransferase/amino-acid acetyltransferase ArgJ [Eubacteriales bacterium]